MLSGGVGAGGRGGGGAHTLSARHAQRDRQRRHALHCSVQVIEPLLPEQRLAASLLSLAPELRTTPRLLRELRLDTDGLTLEHKTAGLLGGLDLHSITFGPDLSVRDMRYSLGAETAVGLLKVLGMVAQLRTGQDLGVRDMESPEFRGIRARVDAEARATLPRMLRDQIRQISGDLPGLPLGQLIGRQQG